MIRAKKPLTLLAAALLLLAFSALFLGDHRALAKVDNPDFESAVTPPSRPSRPATTSRAPTGTDKTAFEGLKSKGERLVETNPGGGTSSG